MDIVEIQKLNETVDSLRVEHTNLLDENIRLANENKESLEKTSLEKEEFLEWKKNKENDIEKLHIEINNIREYKKTEEQGLRCFKEEIGKEKNNLQKSFDLLVEKIESLEKEVFNLRDEKKDLEEDIKNLNTEINTAKSRTIKNTENQSLVDKTFKDKELQIKKTEDELKNRVFILGKKEKKLNTLEQELTEANLRNEQNYKKITDIQKTITEKEKTFIILSEAMKESTEIIEKEKTELMEKETMLSTKEIGLEIREKELEQSETDLANKIKLNKLNR